MRNRSEEGSSKKPEVVAAWRERLGRYATCGTSMTEFAAKEGVKVRQMSWWVHELVRIDRGLPSRNTGRPRKPKADAVAFAKLAVAPPPSAKEALEVVVRGQVAIRVPSQFDAETLRRVVAALEVA